MAAQIEHLAIAVSAKNAPVVSRKLRDIGKAGAGAHKSASLLSRSLGAIGAIIVVRGLLRMVDTYSDIQNKLRQVTSGSEELHAVTGRLGKIANQTRLGFEETAITYARLALSTKSLGVSQGELLSFTKSLNQAVVISGAGAQEAAAGMRQLSQGLASGKLQGDELRSVLENIPFVADVIAKSLGKTRGQLRKMGEEGQLSAEVILDAFKKSRVELEERFARTVPTLSQAFTVLKNNTQLFLGELSTGPVEFFSRAIISLSFNIDTLIRVIGGLAIAAAVTIAVKGLIAAIKLLNIAVSTSPLSSMLIIAAALIGLLITFSDKIKLVSGGVATLADAFEGLGVAAKIIFQDMIELAGSAAGAIGSMLEGVLGPISGDLLSIFKAFIVFKEQVKNTFDLLGTAIKIPFQLALASILSAIDFVIDKMNTVARAGAKVVGFFTDITRDTRADADKFGTKSNTNASLNALGIGAGKAPTAAELASTATNLEAPQLPRLTDSISDLFGLADDNLQSLEDKIEAVVLVRVGKAGVDQIAALEKALAELEAKAKAKLANKKDPFDLSEKDRTGKSDAGARGGKSKLEEELEEETDLLFEASKGYERVLDSLNAVREATRAYNLDLSKLVAADAIGKVFDYDQALSDLKEAYKDLIDPTGAYLRSLDAELAALGDSAIAQEQLNKQLALTAKLKELQIGAADPRAAEIAQKLDEIERLEQNVAITKEFEDAWVGVFDTIADGFTQMVIDLDFSFTNLKDTFKSVAKSIFADLTKLLVQLLLFELLQDSLGPGASPGGSAGTLIGRALGFATGGEFTVGGTGGTDSKLVAFRATPGEHVAVSTPQQKAERDSAGGTRIINVTDPRELIGVMRSSQGEREIVNVVGRHSAAIKRLLA